MGFISAENVSSASYNSNDKGKPLASAIRLSEGSQQTNYSGMAVNIKYTTSLPEILSCSEPCIKLSLGIHSGYEDIAEKIQNPR